MAQVKGFYEPQLTACVHTGDANWSRGDSALLPRIPAASLVANNKYAIIARGMLTGSSAQQVFGLRVSTADATLIAAKSEFKIEPIGTAADNGMVFRFVHSFTTSGTPTDVDMELKTFNTGETVSVDQSSLKLVDLTDLGSSNYFETIHADPGEGTDAYPNPITSQTVEWTIPGSSLGTDEFLIYAYQRTDVAATNSKYLVEILTALDASTSSVVGKDINEGEDGSEYRMSGFVVRHKASSGTPDVEIKTGADTADKFYDLGGYGIAFKTSAWESIVFEYTAGSTSIDTTERTFESVVYQPPTTADHYISGTLNLADTDGTKKPQIHVEDDGAEMRVGDEPMEHHVNYDGGANPLVSIDHQTNILSSDSSTYDLRAKLVADTDNAEHRWLVIWSMELAAAGQTIAVGTLPETDVLIPIVPVKPITVGVGTLAEVESLISIEARKLADIGVLGETDSLIPVVPVKGIIQGVGVLGEVDALVPVVPVKPIIEAVGVLAGTDTLNPIQARKVAVIGTLAEVEALLSIAAFKTAQLGTLGEIDSLIPVAVVQAGDQNIAVGVLAGSDVLRSITIRKTADIGTIGEVGALIAIQAAKTAAIGTLGEVDVLIVVEPVKPIAVTVGTLAELDSLIAIGLIQVVGGWWRKDPAGLTKNPTGVVRRPVAIVKIKAGDSSPW